MSRHPFEPSLNFLVLLLVFCGTGAALWHGWADGQLMVIVFVVSGWIVSLCLHEFAHAATAYAGGDVAVADTGYLDLDPLKYTDPVLSIVLPAIYMLLGGFGLPGGAVWIRNSLLRSRAWISAVSAAGPFANVVFLSLLAGLAAAAPQGDSITDFQAGLAILAYFQATAIVLNLLPFPGLDGFGILRPFLPIHVAVMSAQIGTGSFLVLALLLWYTPLGSAVFGVGRAITDAFGFDPVAIGRGFAMLPHL